jgi:hypothetical protein
MSSDEPVIRQRRRRALDTSEAGTVTVVETDAFDPGPMVHYPPLPVDNNGLPVAPAVRQRVRDLKQMDPRAARDFILKTLHTYLIAHRPVDEIARSFGVTVQRVYQWRQLLYKQIGQELRQKTPTDLIARQIANYEKIKASAWQQFHKADAHTDKNRYLNTVINAERSISDLYARVGMIADTTMKPVVEIVEDVSGQAGLLQNMAKAFLSGPETKKKERTVDQDMSTPIDDNDYLL